MTVFISKRNSVRVAIHTDGTYPTSIIADKGYIPPQTIIVGRVLSSQPNYVTVDIGGPIPALCFVKSKSYTDGQKLLVQIKKTPQKEAFDIKPFEATDLLTLPGPYAYITPHKQGVHISSSISDKSWRETQLPDLTMLASDVSIHIQPDAYKLSPQDLTRELQTQTTKAKALYEKDLASAQPGDIIHATDPEWVRLCRDHTDSIHTDDADTSAILKNCGIQAQFSLKPEWKHEFNARLDEALSPLIQIPGGGVLVIEETQALTAIDVNTSAGSLSSSYSTAKLANDHDRFEFAKVALNEAIRQIYLRNIGGIIMIDLPRLQNRKHQGALDKLVKSYDGGGLQVLGYTKSGLYEFTKKRVGMSLSQTLTDQKAYTSL